jgi:hypothetical protein
MEGVSNCSGFKISESGISVSSKDFCSDKNSISRTTYYALMVFNCSVSGFSLFFIWYSFFNPSILNTILISLLIACPFIEAFILRPYYIEKAEWYATGRKLIYLLENNQELTTENLRAAPIISRSYENKNQYLREPSDDKLRQALSVGLEFLESKG